MPLPVLPTGVRFVWHPARKPQGQCLRFDAVLPGLSTSAWHRYFATVDRAVRRSSQSAIAETHFSARVCRMWLRSSDLSMLACSLDRPVSVWAARSCRSKSSRVSLSKFI